MPAHDQLRHLEDPVASDLHRPHGSRAAHRDERLICVDVLRCAAALLVVWFHLAYWSWAAPSTAQLMSGGVLKFPEVAWSAACGWVGVHLFFVISGLVVMQTATGRTATIFARARFLRLFPTALICATIALLVAASVGVLPLKELLLRYARSVLFIPWGPWIDGVYWTLGVELAFYLVVAVALACKLPPERIELLLIAGGCAIVLMWSVGVSPYEGVDPRTADLTLMHHGQFFAVGCLLARVHRQGWSPTLALVALLLGFGCVLEILHNPAKAVVPAALVWIAGMLFLVVALHYEDTVAKRLHGWRRQIALAGVATYPLYLLHDVSGAALMRLLAYLEVPRFFALAAAIVAAIAGSYAVVLFVEPRIRERIAAVVSGRSGTGLVSISKIVGKPMPVR